MTREARSDENSKCFLLRMISSSSTESYFSGEVGSFVALTKSQPRSLGFGTN